MTAHDLSTAYITSSDTAAWETIEIIVNDNPDYIQARLIQIGFIDAPTSAEQLFQYIYDKLTNGSMNPADFLSALSGAPITAPRGDSKSDGDFWGDLAMIGGIALTTLFPAPTANKPGTTAPPLPAAAAASDNTLIYVAIGSIVVIGIVLLVINLKK
jgi:hypothetical protein